VKVWIKQPEWPAEREYPVTMDWTFEEELAVRRLAQLYIRDVWAGILNGSTLEAAIGLGIVGVMRAEPGTDPSYLLKAHRVNPTDPLTTIASTDELVTVRLEFDEPEDDAGGRQDDDARRHAAADRAGVASVKMAQNFDLLISRMVGLGGVSRRSRRSSGSSSSTSHRRSARPGRARERALPDRVGRREGPARARGADRVGEGVGGGARRHGDRRGRRDVGDERVREVGDDGEARRRRALRRRPDGKGEAAAFAPVLGKVVAVAAQLGVPFDQAAAALAQMTKLGVPADDAATQLSATFSELLKTTPKAEKALKRWASRRPGCARSCARRACSRRCRR
jgi:hypothetical protein